MDLRERGIAAAEEGLMTLEEIAETFQVRIHGSANCENAFMRPARSHLNRTVADNPELFRVKRPSG
ncbi:hypothetical protein GC170_17115 [bacterium]|nr:hypothetical protein [bacterium]